MCNFQAIEWNFILGVLPIPDLKVSSDLKEFSGKRPPAAEPRSLDNFFGKPQSEIEETENRANNAAEDFNIEEKLSKLDDGIVQEGGDKIINNAAEELDGHRIDENKGLGPEENELEVIHRAGNGVKDRLNDEIAGDHGKEAGYPEDLHMIEGQQEENDDLGDGKFGMPLSLKVNIFYRQLVTTIMTIQEENLEELLSATDMTAC